MDGFLVLVEVGDEVLDTALVAERRRVAVGALVDDRDLQAAREEGGLAQALLERVEVEVERLEDLRVGKERDGVASGRSWRELLALDELALRCPARILLGEDVAVAADLDLQTLGQGIDDRYANA